MFSTDHKTLSVFSANNDKESDREDEPFNKCISEDDIKIARYRRKLFRDSVLQEESVDCATDKRLRPTPREDLGEDFGTDGKTASEAIASHKQPYRTKHSNPKLEDDHTVDAEVSTSTRQ